MKLSAPEYQTSNVCAKALELFPEMVVFKDPPRSKLFSGMGIPSFLRDWLVMRFSDSSGNVDTAAMLRYIQEVIPRREDWELAKKRLVYDKQAIRILAKIRVEVDVSSGNTYWAMPDFGFPSRKREAIVDPYLVRSQGEALVRDTELWGVLELEWQSPAGSEGGQMTLVGFRPFRPYRVDLGYYREARHECNLDEWIDILLLAADYNPPGFLNQSEKLALLTRLLPFVESRLNMVELAPKGTGKSYMFSQISKYGWLVSGGSITRARLFYDQARRSVGLVGKHDYVALDEVQSIAFSSPEEIRGALKGYLESGEYRVGDYRGVAEAGFVLLGNIPTDHMDEHSLMFSSLPEVFQESALLDRFHGFLKGWDIPRMRENLKAHGWALNVEYFSEVLHGLRGDLRYRSVVDDLLSVPRGADTRDTEGVKRLATAYLKLLYPHATSPGAIDQWEFQSSCLEPAMRMRGIIRRQLYLRDPEYSPEMPSIAIRASHHP